MKHPFITIVLLGLTGSLSLQSLHAQQSIDEVLVLVEQASKELQAQRKLTDAQKLEAKTGNSLQNPTVEYENLWRRPASGSNSELTFTQPFDFPGVYSTRSKIAKLKASLYDNEGAEFRQQLLLQAKQLCIEIIYLRKQQMLLDERLANAQRLNEVYKQKLETGAANILEINKISVELIGAKTAANLNATTLKTRFQQLSNLAGGEEIGFTATEYPMEDALPEYASLETLYMTQNPELLRLESEHGINQKNVTLSKVQALPNFEVGYRHNYGLEGRFNGVVVGMSIPMFENRHKVKAARAQTYFSDTKLQSAKLNNITVLKQLYEQASTLMQSAESMQSVLRNQNNLELLNKALDAGQISVIEYFTEISTLYQSRETLLQLEKDYRTATAQIYRYEL